MTTQPDDVLVTAAWLHDHLEQVVPVEASFYLPNEGKDGDALFRAGHVPGATRFDVDAIADHTIDLPHMLPSADAFAAMVGRLGIGSDRTLVVYDATDLLGGARAWWMLLHYGAHDVRILDGGFKAWTAAGYPVETGDTTRPATVFAAAFGGEVADAARVLQASASGSAQIVDARAAPRFEGTVAEPRAGLRSGHIPTSRNVPWQTMINAEGRLRAPQEIAEVFRKAGVDLEQPIITSCGSGVSAAVLILGLERVGVSGVGLYDGSWSDWGARADLPLETGPARM